MRDIRGDINCARSMILSIHDVYTIEKCSPAIIYENLIIIISTRLNRTGRFTPWGLLSHGATRLVGKEDKTRLVIVFRKYSARVLEKSIGRLGNGRSGNAMHYRRCVVVVAGTARKG